MSAPLELCACEEIGVVIWYLRLKNKCSVEIHREIVATYGTCAMHARNVRRWVVEH